MLVIPDAAMLKLKDSNISVCRKYLFDDSKNAINGNKLRTYRTLKTAYCLEKQFFSRKKVYIQKQNKKFSHHKRHVEEGKYRRENMPVVSLSKLGNVRKAFSRK